MCQAYPDSYQSQYTQNVGGRDNRYLSRESNKTARKTLVQLERGATKMGSARVQNRKQPRFPRPACTFGRARRTGRTCQKDSPHCAALSGGLYSCQAASRIDDGLSSSSFSFTYLNPFRAVPPGAIERNGSTSHSSRY
jgi:hypothetical protein